MQLFEFTKILFENPAEWANITPGEKRKQYFMVQRRFAIQFPMQANALQHLKVNQAGVMDFWQKFMWNIYKGRTPGWMYTKGVKKAKEVKERKNHNITGSLISQYAAKMEIDKKSIYDALEFYPDLIVKEIKQFEKVINQK